MSSITRFAAGLLALAVVAAPAMARDGRHSHDGDRGRHGQDRYHDRSRDRSHDHRGDRYRHYDRVVIVPGWRRPAYRVPPPAYRPPPRRAYYRGYPRWNTGMRYYGHGYAPTYVVRDYGYYGLRAPPRGYYWRRDDRGEFLLVAIATGIITDLILHGGY